MNAMSSTYTDASSTAKSAVATIAKERTPECGLRYERMRR
jgi:hypothetical protein